MRAATVAYTASKAISAAKAASSSEMDEGIDAVAIAKKLTESKSGPKVLAAHGSEKGDRYELHAHMPGEKHEWHAIVKTHQKGTPTKNEYGGYSAQTIGTPKYVASKWKQKTQTKLNESEGATGPFSTSMQEVKHKGKVIGHTYKASNGEYGWHHNAQDFGAVGADTREEAEEGLHQDHSDYLHSKGRKGLSESVEDIGHKKAVSKLKKYASENYLGADQVSKDKSGTLTVPEQFLTFHQTSNKCIRC